MMDERMEMGEVQGRVEDGGAGEMVVTEGPGERRERRTNPEGRECKILQPHGTHGDVISTTKPETYYNSAVLQPPSHSVFMYE